MGRRDFAGPAGGVLFQRAEDIQHVRGFLGAELFHDGAAGGDQLDQTFAGQKLDRLAQGRARYAKLRTDLTLVDAGAGRQVALDDHITQPVQDRIVQGLPFDLIQVWGFRRPPLRDLATVNGERIVHAVADGGGSIVGITTGALFTVDVDTGTIAIVGPVAGAGRIAVGSRGRVFGQDGPGDLWRYDTASRTITRHALKLPEGVWDKSPMTWARDNRSGLLYTADGQGRLFALDEDRGFSPVLGLTALAPVGPMAVTHDGRVFGFCGSEMARMFCYNPAARAVSDLGVAVSVLERRRYGYLFGDAVVGRDGQIVFGEDDDLGHLWLYFPRIERLKD